MCNLFSSTLLTFEEHKFSIMAFVCSVYVFRQADPEERNGHGVIIKNPVPSDPPEPPTLRGTESIWKIKKLENICTSKKHMTLRLWNLFVALKSKNYSENGQLLFQGIREISFKHYATTIYYYFCINMGYDLMESELASFVMLIEFARVQGLLWLSKLKSSSVQCT